MVTIKDLAFSYGKKEVLRGVDLELPVGQIHGILGMNGAGKTTLFHLLYQRLVPTAGDCRWQHRALLPEHIAFQETEHYFYPYLKGREYLELLSQSNPDFSIDRWNDIFELPLDQLIDGYSTGMRKKLAFIGVLSLDRPILLLDEPFNGVDVESNEKLLQILLRLRDRGKLIILSSHLIQSLTAIADRVHFLRDGRIQQSYPRESFPYLERELKEWIGGKIQKKLDRLL